MTPSLVNGTGRPMIMYGGSVDRGKHEDGDESKNTQVHVETHFQTKISL